jgi:hypothetical protein
VDKSRSNNPLYKLRLQHFITALIFVASQLTDATIRRGQRIIDTKGKHFAPSRRNGDIHTLLCKALPVFGDWPNNYYSFLDACRYRKVGDKPKTDSRIYFEEYKSALFRQLAVPEFEFMRTAFKQYRRIWHYESYIGSARLKEVLAAPTRDKIENGADGRGVGTVSVSKDIDEFKPLTEQPRGGILRLEETHVSGNKAQEILKLGWRGLKELISSGKLKAIVCDNGERKVTLVEKASLEKLTARLKDTLYLKEVKGLLGIHSKRVKELVECGLLKTISDPNGDRRADWRFDRVEVAHLLGRLTSGVPKRRNTKRSKALSFNSVLRRIGRAGIDLGMFVHAVLNGEIKPSGRTKKETLQCLLFSDKQVKIYIQGEFRLLVGSALSLSEVRKLLRVTQDAVNFLVKKRILHAEKFANIPFGRRLVKREDFDVFNDTYLLLKQIASVYGTSSKHVLELLASCRVHPISGPGVDRGYAYVFKKSDVKALDLAALISKGKGGQLERTTSKSPSSVLDETQVAELLKSDVETVRLLAERGTLKPYRRLSHYKVGKYYFSHYTVEKYKKLSTDRGDLVAFVVAAKLFNLYLDNFYNKYVMTGRLKPVISNSRRSEHFFRMKDVESLLEIEKQTIITPEAAEILGVYVSVVNKLIASGDLKPISGPAVDGFGKNLFLRSNVEKLREEREAFKAERMEEGKGSRFGKQAGSKASPVLDVIGPRIDQLVEKWQERRPERRITGEHLYQQLIKEGYRTGINAVYVYLRQNHRKAA